MALVRVVSFFRPVVQHLDAPTSSPSVTPTVNFVEHSAPGASNVDAMVIGMSASFGFLFIGMNLIHAFC